uniref:Uncharacterized protein n=1 Tax=Oreochromis niloticus TaxID=8128 RepID=A0A669C460_ORENI
MFDFVLPSYLATPSWTIIRSSFLWLAGAILSCILGWLYKLVLPFPFSPSCGKLCETEQTKDNRTQHQLWAGSPSKSISNQCSVTQGNSSWIIYQHSNQRSPH